MAQRDFTLEVVGFAAQRSDLEAHLAAQQSELETRSEDLEVRRQELDVFSATLQGWREQLQTRRIWRRAGSPSPSGRPTPPA